jgi:hypothetical protein
MNWSGAITGRTRVPRRWQAEQSGSTTSVDGLRASDAVASLSAPPPDGGLWNGRKVSRPKTFAIALRYTLRTSLL